MRYIPRKIWIPAVIILIIGVLSYYNRPVTLKKAVLMSTPLIFRDGLIKPYDKLPDDIAPSIDLTDDLDAAETQEARAEEQPASSATNDKPSRKRKRE